MRSEQTLETKLDLSPHILKKINTRDRMEIIGIERLELSTQELGFIGLWTRSEAEARDTRETA